jgi:hypothetical protein
MNETNSVCKQHIGLVKEIKYLENNVHELWQKWDNMQKTVIGIFVTLSLNLIMAIVGIALLIKAG